MDITIGRKANLGDVTVVTDVTNVMEGNVTVVTDVTNVNLGDVTVVTDVTNVMVTVMCINCHAIKSYNHSCKVFRYARITTHHVSNV